jgi:apolipoprotein N-acyltransferase
LLSRSLDYPLAAISGVLLALSFPSYGHPAFGWIALGPLLIAIATPKGPHHGAGGQSLGRAFGLGLTTGVVYFTGTLYWITRVMVVYGGLHPVVAVLVNAALIAYLALFPAFFSVMTRRLVATSGDRALMAVPLVWVATELGRTHLFGGFPWVLLGYSQAAVLPVAQLASVFGVYGVSALVAAVSAAVAVGACRSIEGPRPVGSGISWIPSRLSNHAPFVFVLAIVLGVAIWGSYRVSRGELTRAGEAVRVGLVQGNVDQAEKWDPKRAAAIFESYLGMTRQAIHESADLVVWPESATPFTFEDDRRSAERVRALAREAQVSILLGSDEIERGVPTRYYNSAFLVKSDGSTAGVYRKIHLVPFGEYVPLKRVFFFAAPLVEAVSDFSPGESAILLPIDGHRISTSICYEIVYPNLVRRFVRAGSELLTTITNDAWFGRTSAPYQHFAQASMRAVETGRYLVRSANTGVSGVVDPYGRVLVESAIFEPAVIVAQARFLTASTVYTRTGDLFAYACAISAVAMLVVGRRRVK